MSIEIGTTSKGTVVRVAEYGAMVRLPGGQMGLIHISEIAEAFVRDVRDYLNEDDEVTVKVLRINDKGRYELSVKQAGVTAAPRESVAVGAGVGSVQARAARPSYHAGPPPMRPAVAFEDRLSRFLKDSEERQHDLKRHIETKRGRR